MNNQIPFPHGGRSHERTDKITIKTPSATYSCTDAWLENEDLAGILAGMVADDFTRFHGGEF